jgi:hypothetical protein
MERRFFFLPVFAVFCAVLLTPANAAVEKGHYLIYEGINTQMTVLWQLDDTYTQLTPMTISTDASDKPQSKVWTHDGLWWTVLPNSSGTFLWRLDGTRWTNILKLSSYTDTRADVKVSGNVVHILLYRGISSELVSAEYVSATRAYQLWTERSTTSSVQLDSGGETATLDIDSTGRMWVGFDTSSEIRVRYSDWPYSNWTAVPITIASGVNADDICVVTAMPDASMGVLWSNQNARRFGFRVHTDGTDPTVWSDEATVRETC